MTIKTRDLLSSEVAFKDFEDVVDQLQDLLNNSKCSCVRTLHNPCSRCKVSIDQSQELLDRIYAEYGIHEED